MLIRDKMIPNPLCLKEEQTVFTAKELMLLNELDCLYVVDEGHTPVGVVTSLAASAEASRSKVSKVMSAEIVTVREDQPLQEAALVFAKRNYNRVTIPVVDAAGVFVGVVRMRELIGVLSTEGPGAVRADTGPPGKFTPETAAVRLSMSRAGEEERDLLDQVREASLLAAVTQVGANAEKLPIKMREAAIVAAIAHGTIKETLMEKVALTNAVRDIINQMEMVSPGLGGGYKISVVRGEGRVAVGAFGRCGHALANSSEHIFLGTAII